MFFIFIVNQRYFYPVKLSILSKKLLVIELEQTAILYVFWMSVYCTPILKIFLETIMVSRYCLQTLSNKNCLYWIREGFVKIVFASGDPIVVTFFLDLKSFFMSVSRWHVILKSILRGKFAFPKSIKYLIGILWTNSFFSWFWYFVIPRLCHWVLCCYEFFYQSLFCYSTQPIYYKPLFLQVF